MSNTASNSSVVKDAIKGIETAENALSIIDLRTLPKGPVRDAVKTARIDLKATRKLLLDPLA